VQQDRRPAVGVEGSHAGARLDRDENEEDEGRGNEIHKPELTVDLLADALHVVWVDDRGVIPPRRALVIDDRGDVVIV